MIAIQIREPSERKSSSLMIIHIDGINNSLLWDWIYKYNLFFSKLLDENQQNWIATNLVG